MNDQTRCSIVREKLPLYVGGDLDSDGQELVRSHLEGCGGCARDAAAAARSREAFLAHLGLESREHTASGSFLANPLEFISLPPNGLQHVDRGATAGREPAHLWERVRAELVREGRIVDEAPFSGRDRRSFAGLDASPAIPFTPEAAPEGRLVFGRFGTRIAAAAALILALMVGQRMLAGGAAGSSGSSSPGIAATEGAGALSSGPTLVQHSSGAPAAGDSLPGSPVEGGLRPLLRRDADLLRDAMPVVYPAPTLSGSAGSGQLAGYSGGKKLPLR